MTAVSAAMRKIAGKCDREAGARRGARQRGDRRFRHLVEPQRRAAVGLTLHVHAQELVDRLARGIDASHVLHVAAGAEGAARTRQDDAADVVVELGRGQLVAQLLLHGHGQGIAVLGPIERQDQDAVLAADQKVLGLASSFHS